MKLGQLKTTKRVEQAIREIRDWLDKIGIHGLGIDTRYDASQNIALASFSYEGKRYEFRSTNQVNCRLNMWAIARVMEYKVRSHIMGIENFEKSMRAYLLLEASEEAMKGSPPMTAESKDYVVLGIGELASNQELKSNYKKLAKAWHPDMAGSDEAKKSFEDKFAEINAAWNRIKKARGI